MDLDGRSDKDSSVTGAGFDPSDPFEVAFQFLEGIREPVEWAEALSMLVTPESLDDWGDFTAANEWISARPGSGLLTGIQSAFGTDDVVYVRVIADVVRPERALDPGE